MALYTKYVDPVSGSNSNTGDTAADAYATLLYACDSGNGGGSWGADDTLVVYVIPSGPLQANDYARCDADWDGARLFIRSSVEGVRWKKSWAFALFYFSGDCVATVRIDDCDATVEQVVGEQGTITAGNQTGIITIGSNCRFTKYSTSASFDAYKFSNNAVGCKLTIEPGVTHYGWASPFLVGATTIMSEVDIDGVVFDSTTGLARSSTLVASSIDIRNCTFKQEDAVANYIDFRCSGTKFKFRNNTCTSNTTATSGAFNFLPPAAGGSTTVELEVTGNTFAGTIAGELVRLGNNLNSTPASRATEDATVEQFASVLFKDNSVINYSEDGSTLYVMVGTNNAKIYDNYFRRGTLGNGVNVHVCYLWGDGIDYRGNDCQGQVLAFGPNQKLANNLILGKIGILLGGTQGGSTAVTGGNNYHITNNILITTGTGALNDYAYNGAYPTNLGALVAEVQDNIYVPLAGSSGAVRLTAAGLYGTTTAEVRNLWNESVVSGSGSGVWGDASNENNDQYSRVVTGAELSWYETLIAAAANELTPSDMAAIRLGPPDRIVYAINEDSTQTTLRNNASTAATQATNAATDAAIAAGEVVKIHRAASAVTAGANSTRTKVSASETVLVEVLS